MHLSSLRLYNFRNFTEEQIQFAPQVNFVVGRNGQGKTNLIEAVNVLSLARSFRTSTVTDLVRWGEKEASAFAQIHQRDGDLELGIAIKGKTKTAYVNGNKVAALGDYVGKLMCVSFSPDDLELVKGGPKERRNFIDRHLIDVRPGLMSQMLQYHRALKHKNQLLRERVEDLAQYEPWNRIMAESGLKIIEAREAFIGILENAAQPLHAEFTSGDGVLGLRHHSSATFTEAGSIEAIVAALQDRLPAELAVKRSLSGPHRDDLLIKLHDHPARAFASQGQSRSIVLALKLAAIAVLEKERGESPVVLLDDVDSELDRGRGEAFFQMILGGDRQVLITGTELRDSLGETAQQAKIVEICSGKIEKYAAKKTAE